MFLVISYPVGFPIPGYSAKQGCNGEYPLPGEAVGAWLVCGVMYDAMVMVITRLGVQWNLLVAVAMH